MRYDNLNNGGQITISGTQLVNGIYLYGLYNKNEEIITKKMIVTK